MAAVADLRDLLAGLDVLAGADQRAVDVAVGGDGAVVVADPSHSPKPLAGPNAITSPASGTWIGVPMGRRCRAPCARDPSAQPKPEVTRPVTICTSSAGTSAREGTACGSGGAAWTGARGASGRLRRGRVGCRGGPGRTAVPLGRFDERTDVDRARRGDHRADGRGERPSGTAGDDVGVPSSSCTPSLRTLAPSEAIGRVWLSAACPAAASAPPASTVAITREPGRRRTGMPTRRHLLPLPPRAAAAGARGVCAGPGGSGA